MRRLDDLLHKASRSIVDYAMSGGAHTIVIGHTKGWKSGSDMDRRNNQNFVQMAHTTLIQQVTYKAAEHGITVLTSDEAWTSQTSFPDGEPPMASNGNKARKAKGIVPTVRCKCRGLFFADNGTVINSDVNATLQILKHAVPDAKFGYGIPAAVSRPAKWKIKKTGYSSPPHLAKKHWPALSRVADGIFVPDVRDVGRQSQKRV